MLMAVEVALEILELPASATMEEVRDQYRKKILLAHPDKGGSAEDFELIQDAFNTVRSVRSDVNQKMEMELASRRLREEYVEEHKELADLMDGFNVDEFNRLFELTVKAPPPPSLINVKTQYELLLREREMDTLTLDMQEKGKQGCAPVLLEKKEVDWDAFREEYEKPIVPTEEELKKVEEEQEKEKQEDRNIHQQFLQQWGTLYLQ